MSDIVERLLRWGYSADQSTANDLMGEAAAQIAHLRSEKASDWRAACESARAASAEIARLRLTDEERECLEWAEEIAGNCEEFGRVEVLRGLLERLWPPAT